MLKQVIEYLNSESKTIAYYTDRELVKTIAFIFLVVCYIVCYSVATTLLFCTAPVWIIPYCIYTGRKERQ